MATLVHDRLPEITGVCDRVANGGQVAGATRRKFFEALEEAARAGASDLHFTVGEPVALRVNSEIVKLEIPWDGEDVTHLWAGRFYQAARAGRVCEMALARMQQPATPAVDFDTEYEVTADNHRAATSLQLRVHVGRSRGIFTVSCRNFGSTIPSTRALGTPAEFCVLADGKGKGTGGLLLVCGPTGSGKSTTLAAVLQEVMARTRCKLITCEDPIEYDIPSGRGIVQQRALGPGLDVETLPEAIKSALRDDPDLIMFGELRHPAEIVEALKAAATGHLVFGTLHTGSAAQTLSRFGLEDAFTSQMAAQHLRGVLCQKLLMRADGKGRIAAYELMKVNHAIRGQIQESRTQQIRASIAQGHADGMFTFARYLAEMVFESAVTADVACDVVGDHAAEYAQHLKYLRETKGKGPRVFIPADRPSP